MNNHLSVDLVQHVGSDEMVANAARVSTDSDNKGKSIEGLIKYLAKAGHNCYDDHTEVLTRRGWVFWPDVENDDEFLSIDLETQKSEYVTASHITRDDFDGNMVRIKSQGADLLVTENHNLVVSERLSNTRWSAWKLQAAGKPKERCYRMCNAMGTLVGQKLNLPLCWLEFLGFVLGDGHVPGGKGEPGNISFHLHKQRKVDYLISLVDQIDGCSVVFDHCGRGRVKGCPDELMSLAEDTYLPDGTRAVPPIVLHNASGEEAEVFVRGYLNADGSLRRDRGGSYSFSAVGSSVINDISQLAATCGMAVTVGAPQKISTVWNSKHELAERATVKAGRNIHPRFGWTNEDYKNQVSREHYVGKVYCATVKHGTLYVRRNGIPIWSGNSPFEHNSITFMVSAPLFVRDQWVRHRTQSYNILSFRYTDQESDHPMELFYFPDENRPLVNSGTKAHPKFDKAPTKYELACANDILHDAYADAYSSYLDLLQQGVASEIARAVLPSGTMTRFYATANLRNWYQFCKERLAENAQYEIRVCAEQVDKILAELFPISWPALFADSDTTDQRS